MTKITSRDRIASGKVPAAIAREMDAKSLDNWASLGNAERMRFYDAAVTDHRLAHAMENGFLNNKGGQGVARGRGGCLVNAILDAYNVSDAHRAEAAAADEARKREKLECQICHNSFTESGMLVSGNRAMCFGCVWEKYPESAAMLDLPKPAQV